MRTSACTADVACHQLGEGTDGGRAAASTMMVLSKFGQCWQSTCPALSSNVVPTSFMCVNNSIRSCSFFASFAFDEVAGKRVHDGKQNSNRPTVHPISVFELTTKSLQCKQTRLGRLQCGNSNCGMHLSRYAADEVCASFERRSRECPPWKPWKQPVACREAMPSRSRKCCNYLINHVVNGLYMLQRYYQQVPSTFWRSRPEDGTFLVLVKQRLDVGFGAAI